MANKDMYFRADIARSGEVSVIRENKVISGFAVVTKGVTHDERGEFDDQSLDTVVALGNQSKMGIKSRFGHPNMSNTALGTFLGRTKNFRRDGNIVRADLHIDPTAHQTPDGDLAGYVMQLAESDPHAFGSSMVIQWDEGARSELGQDGKKLPPFIRVRKLMSVDVVDDPAANDGLFGSRFFSDSVKPSAEVTAFLDRFLDQPEAVEKVVGFLERYRFNNHQPKEQGMFEDLTVPKLKEQRADLYQSVFGEGEAEGKKAGEKFERERVIAILKKSKTFKNMDDLALEVIEKGESLEAATIKFQDKQLEGLKKTSTTEVGPDLEEDPVKKATTHLEKAKAYKLEHGCTLTEALRKTAAKR